MTWLVYAESVNPGKRNPKLSTTDASERGQGGWTEDKDGQGAMSYLHSR